MEIKFNKLKAILENRRNNFLLKIRRNVSPFFVSINKTWICFYRWNICLVNSYMHYKDLAEHPLYISVSYAKQFCVCKSWDQMLFVPQWGKITMTDRHAMVQHITISESGQTRLNRDNNSPPCRKAFPINNFIKWRTNKHKLDNIHECNFVSKDYLTWQ